jgi:hypothetical protein
VRFSDAPTVVITVLLTVWFPGTVAAQILTPEGVYEPEGAAAPVLVVNAEDEVRADAAPADPEMQALLIRYFEVTPCGTRMSGLCPEALALLEGGGDRLAAYLIVLAERSPENHRTFLRLLGHTESDRAYRYLAEALRRPDPRFDPITVIESLGRTRDRRVVADLAPRLMADADPEVQLRIVNALDRVQAKHGPLPEVRSVLLEFDAKRRGPGAASVAEMTTPGLLGDRVRDAIDHPGRVVP